MNTGQHDDRSTEAEAPRIDGFLDLVEIGRGGCSTVYSATQVDFDRRVAVKVLDFSGAEARRIEREARAVGRMTDLPNVVQAFQVVSTTDGRPALVMALLPGSLAQLIRARGAAPPDDVARWTAQLTRALEAAHGFELYHRDIKPENVLISAYGDAYLADFGIAAMDDMAVSTATAASLSPCHAPPERLTGDQEFEIAGDVYSLASTLYTALSGASPFGTSEEGGIYGLMERVLKQPLRSGNGVSPQVHAVLSRAMAKEAGDRYATVREFGDHMMTALGATEPGTASAPLSAVPDTSWTGPRPGDDDHTRVRPRSGVPVGDDPVSASAPSDRPPAAPVGDDSPPTAQPPARRRRTRRLVAVVAAIAVVAVGAAAFVLTRTDAPLALIQMGAGRSHTCALQPSGTVACWGANWFGQLGSGDPARPAGSAAQIVDASKRTDVVVSDEWTSTPRAVDGIEGARQVAVGRNHSCALLDSGAVSCWGSNTYGQLGAKDVETGETNPAAWRARAEEVSGIDDAVQISAGHDFTCALVDDGSVRCWGVNWAGQLGDSTVPAGDAVPGAWSAVPVQVQDLTHAVAISAGGSHVCALHDDGSASCWGANFTGQLGTEAVPTAGGGKTDWTATPTAVALGGIVQLAAGGRHTCARLDNATVSCWGENRMGQLGNVRGSDTSELGSVVRLPVPVTGLSAVNDVSAGGESSCAVLGDGSAVCWGADDHGQLGVGSTGDDQKWSYKPVAITGVEDAVSVVAGPLHICAVTESQHGWCWGGDIAGQTSRPPSGDADERQPQVIRG